MFFDKDGNEISAAEAMEAMKTSSEYNAEIDRLRGKFESDARDKISQASSEFEAEKDRIAADLEKQLEQARTLAGGKKDEKIELLIQANKETAGTVEELKRSLMEERQANMKNGLKADLAKNLAKVGDDFVRESLIDKAMRESIIHEGKAYFKTSSGDMVDAQTLANSYESEYPNHFISPQKGGPGINGNQTGNPSTGKPKPGTPEETKAALGARLAEKGVI